MSNTYNCVFKRIANNHTRLRTDEVTGTTKKLPKKGEIFVMAAKPLDPKASGRIVNTSRVERVVKNNDTYTIYTESGSIYMIEILNEKNGQKSH